MMMDNIDENNILRRIDREEVNEACFHCNGFYGSCFDEPLCPTCHDFLYIEDFTLSPSLIAIRPSLSSYDKDDDDSGNDEPSENPPLIPVPLPESLGVEGGGGGEGESVNSNNSGIDDKNRIKDEGGGENEEERGVSEYEKKCLGRRVELLSTPSPSYYSSSKSDLTHMLPPEIWRMIFEMLDPLSALLGSRVCVTWKSIIVQMHTNEKWREFCLKRFPLFKPIYQVSSWYAVFSSLCESLCCTHCWIKMYKIPAIGALQLTRNKLRSVRLSKELKLMRSDYCEGIEAVPLDEYSYNWLARILGPRDSPYQGGVFYINIKILPNYPLSPPIVRFLTRIYHPNISRHGDVGIDCIGHNWTLALYIPQTLLSVQSLLTDPQVRPAMEPTIGHLFEQDKSEWERVAKEWTWRYAMTDILLT